jgi:hypothetical protein
VSVLSSFEGAVLLVEAVALLGVAVTLIGVVVLVEPVESLEGIWLV